MINRTTGPLSHALLAGASVIAISSAAPALAQEATRTFDIPAQPLSSALMEYSRQADTPVLASMDLLKGKTAPPVSGDLPQKLALQMLLEGSGLRAVQGASGGIVVEKAAADPQSGSAAGDGAEVEALIVTAQKREEDIQDVPIAISAFTQEDLTRSQVAGGPDLMTQVPNFTFTKTNFSSYSIQIRGIGTQAISATTDAAVAVAFNNTPFIRNRFFEQEFYDLQRVEVLRGPQGTLYGRNATAGVVNIISAKPSFSYEAKLSGDIANYASRRLEGMVNVPLVEDVVALRLAGAWTKREGFVTNEITNNPIDGRDLWSTRVSLRFTPTDRIDANLIWEHFEENDDRLRSGKQLCKKDIVTEVGGVPVTYTGGAINSLQGNLSQGCAPASLYSPDSFQTPNGYSLPYYHPLGAIGLPVVPGLDPYLSTKQSRDLRVIESTVDPKYRAETDLVELQVDVDLTSNLTLSSETGYLSDTLFSTQDFNRFNTARGAFNPRATGLDIRPGLLDANGTFCDPQIGCADRLVAVDLSTADSHHFSQEFRVASDYEGPFNFSLGANFLRYDTEDKYYVFVNTLTLYAARKDGLPDYVGGVSDNAECLQQGFVEPTFNVAYDVNNTCAYIDPNPITSLNDMGHNYFLSRNPYKLISYAVFGESYYNISDTLKLTAGLRWTVDKKEAPRIPSWILAGGKYDETASGAGYSTFEVIEQEWREPTGRLAIDWKPALAFTDETLLYASYARGYKAGGANPPPAGLVLYESGGKKIFVNNFVEGSAARPKVFDPEFVNAFELGAKNTFAGGTITVNTAAFYYDYTGYQISQIVDRSATNLNFDAKVWGLEIEADWRPLENLRLGFKGGYEKTRMADGSRAIDLMDRTNGDPNYVLVRPFPSLPSNCILPVNTIVAGGVIDVPGQVEGGNISACELAYILGLDPVTELPYVPDPTVGVPARYLTADYPGFNPFDPYVNGGAGIFKDLSGNELPNAPHYTATLTADYTTPLMGDWLVTLHTDLYYQSEAWTRIFNTEGYDKLKAYTNVNLAAIINSEERGWTVMAYIKNVMDRDSITGAFLNSDDTGLTTNVFLTEPRLYGVRVTKQWTGGPWWTGASPGHTGPHPLTVELGGQVQRHDAPYERLAPDFVDVFSEAIDPTAPQNRDLDWGDGREVRIVYRPGGSPWSFALGARSGRTNSDTARLHLQEAAGPAVCQFPIATPFGQRRCNPDYVVPGYDPGYFYAAFSLLYPTNWSDSTARGREEHAVVDFEIGRDVGLGILGGTRSTLAAGVRYAELESITEATMDGIPNWSIPDGWFFANSSNDRYRASFETNREFSGVGPTLSWQAASALWGTEETGVLNVDWTVTGGVLFGKQKTSIVGEEEHAPFVGRYYNITSPLRVPAWQSVATVDTERENSTSVPLLDVSLGLSYEIQRVRVGAGYRWERYFDVLDAGFEEAADAHRTIDGPYFKLSVGFGG